MCSALGPSATSGGATALAARTACVHSPQPNAVAALCVHTHRSLAAASVPSRGASASSGSAAVAVGAAAASSSVGTGDAVAVGISGWSMTCTTSLPPNSTSVRRHLATASWSAVTGSVSTIFAGEGVPLPSAAGLRRRPNDDHVRPHSPIARLCSFVLMSASLTAKWCQRELTRSASPRVLGVQ